LDEVHIHRPRQRRGHDLGAGAVVEEHDGIPRVEAEELDVPHARGGSLAPDFPFSFFVGCPFAAGASSTAIGAGGVSPARAMPCFSRTARSICVATSGFAFKKSLAFSRPWPMRSPFQANHAPDFSTTFASDARSSTSPSLLMPSPYMMSNSTSRNG